MSCSKEWSCSGVCWRELLQGTPLASSCAPLTSESPLVLKFQKETELKVGKKRDLACPPSPLPTPPWYQSHCREGARENPVRPRQCAEAWVSSPVVEPSPVFPGGHNLGGILEATRGSFPQARRVRARLRGPGAYPAGWTFMPWGPGLGGPVPVLCCPPRWVCTPNCNTLGRHCLPPHWQVPGTGPGTDVGKPGVSQWARQPGYFRACFAVGITVSSSLSSPGHGCPLVSEKSRHRLGTGESGVHLGLQLSHLWRSGWE